MVISDKAQDVFDGKADGAIIQGDCLDVMKGWPAGCVDAVVVVTDPPYGIGFVKGASGGQGAYRGRVGDARLSRSTDRVVGDDVPFDPAPLLRFSNVLMWGANHYCQRLPETGRWLAWNKLEHIESFDSFSDVDFAWHSQGKASRIFNYMWKGGLACRKAGENNGRRVHPTQKPVGLMLWCIDQVKAPPDAIILDPFAGSFTTCVAAKKLGRRWIGIEINPAYVEIGRRRLAATPKPLPGMEPTHGS